MEKFLLIHMNVFQRNFRYFKNKEHKKLNYLLLIKHTKIPGQPSYKISFELTWTRTENTSMCRQTSNIVFLVLTLINP